MIDILHGGTQTTVQDAGRHGHRHLGIPASGAVGLAGAEMWAQINGQNVKNFSATSVHKGDILTLSFARDGCRAYIAVAGGLKVAEFMESTATYLPAALGGIENRR